MLDDAETFYRKAVELNPNYAEAYNNLGNLLRNKNQLPASAKAAETAFDNAADTSIAGAEFESEAEKYFRRAIELNPNYAEAYNNIGNLFNDTGRIGEAKEFYLKALSIKPDFAVCHKNLAQIKTFDKGDPQLKTLNNLYNNFKNNDNKNKDNNKGNYNDQNDNKDKKEDNFSDRIKNSSDKIYICFALAKANEDLNEIDAAFDLYSEGNKLMKMKLNYNIAQDISLFENIKSLFASAAKTPIFPASASAPAIITSPAPATPPNIAAFNIAPENIAPIMIVGMPRSGTSLAEQIIASHSKVFGGGEINLMDELVKKYYLESKEHCASGGAEEISRFIASDYVNEINRYESIYRLTENGKKYFTDKMPLNFRWLGFIMLFNPAVKIIHAVRNRDAVCWSVFKQLFSGTGMGFAYDLKDIYKYYGLYENLMEFWEEMFPSRIYRLDYERLTLNQKEETKKLLDYCGLEWEDGCMEFEKNKRAVRTASFAQVRKKIYKGSSEEWKKFKNRIERALI
jgi:Tfp pilus assembly protein PilF